MVGGSSDNFHITLFLCFYFSPFFLCFPPLPILLSRTQGYAYHRLGTTGLSRTATGIELLLFNVLCTEAKDVSIRTEW
jgi:hypothetical protein